MGRRRKTRKRIITRPQRRLPKIFTCPNCGSTTVNVKQDKKAGKVKVVCGNCGLEAEFELVQGLMPVDYYNKFVDLYYQGQIAPKKEEVITLEQLQAMSSETPEETVTASAEEGGERVSLEELAASVEAEQAEETLAEASAEVGEGEETSEEESEESSE